MKHLIAICCTALLATACATDFIVGDMTQTHESPITGTGCGGFAGLTCSSGKVCVDVPNDGCDPAAGAVDCLGTCEDPPAPPPAKTTCGGIAGIQCADGSVCVDDPADSCDPHSGGGDCPGVCAAANAKSCGGFAGLTCPSDETCVDDPRDPCTPGNGADCPGLCVKTAP